MAEDGIDEGWAPGLIGWCVAEHGRYYAAQAGFGAVFEAKVAREMAAFAARLAPPRAAIFRAADGEGFLATVSIDGSDAPGGAQGGLAHLRWFIAAERARGRGLGKALLARAIAAARAAGMGGVYLDTFAGLDAARAVYERAGSRLVHEAPAETWGTTVLEQRFELRFGEAP